MENPEKFVFFITTLAFDFFFAILIHSFPNNDPLKGEKHEEKSVSLLCLVDVGGLRRAGAVSFQTHEGDIVYTSPDAPLVLYDEEWNIKSLLPHCKDNYQIPLQPGLVKIKTEKIILFGNAAEYAPEFPESRITYVNPLDFFEPAPNTEKIILPLHDTREFSYKIDRY